MRCMCAGIYPSIEEQARRLHDEPGMPEWSMETYIAKIEATNLNLLAIIIEAFRRRLATERRNNALPK